MLSRYCGHRMDDESQDSNSLTQETMDSSEECTDSEMIRGLIARNDDLKVRVEQTGAQNRTLQISE